MRDPIAGRPHFNNNWNMGGLSSLCLHSVVSISVLVQGSLRVEALPALFCSVSSTPQQDQAHKRAQQGSGCREDES